MFYTTASDALVAPKLKMGPLERRVLYGKVAASFANEPYVQQKCQTPIPVQSDLEYGGSTCIAIEHAGQAYVKRLPGSSSLLITNRYHNYMQYLSNWTNHIARGTGSDDLSKRPVPVAMLYDNTTSKSSFLRTLLPVQVLQDLQGISTHSPPRKHTSCLHPLAWRRAADLEVI